MTSLAGLFFFGIPFGIISLIFGYISTGKISKNPKKFKGKGYAIAAILIGLLDIVSVIIFLSSI
ncbi:MAG: DUF4190 domain-containing protein [Bacteroidales bacterium]|nr:DUF4190 domain-containing protein [Bacteroidales bacterium]